MTCYMSSVCNPQLDKKEWKRVLPNYVNTRVRTARHITYITRDCDPHLVAPAHIRHAMGGRRELLNKALLPTLLSAQHAHLLPKRFNVMEPIPQSTFPAQGIIVKPVAGVRSQFVHVCHTQAEMKSYIATHHITKTRSFHRPHINEWVAEEFLDSFLSDGKRLILNFPIIVHKQRGKQTTSVYLPHKALTLRAKSPTQTTVSIENADVFVYPDANITLPLSQQYLSEQIRSVVSELAANSHFTCFSELDECFTVYGLDVMLVKVQQQTEPAQTKQQQQQTEAAQYKLKVIEVNHVPEAYTSDQKACRRVQDSIHKCVYKNILQKYESRPKRSHLQTTPQPQAKLKRRYHRSQRHYRRMMCPRHHSHTRSQSRRRRRRHHSYRSY